MSDDIGIDGIEASGLLDGLDGVAHEERADVIEWLLGARHVKGVKGEVKLFRARAAVAE